jgi:LicD family
MSGKAKTGASTTAVEADATEERVRALPPHKAGGVGADIFGAARLTLAKLVQPALNLADLTWYLDGGTLLGAHRSGEQIAHDDDFDIAAYLPDFRDDDLEGIRRKIAARLPAPYATRIVTSYARKVEIFDSGSETFLLPPAYRGADFHVVTVDVQIMTDAPDGVRYLHDMLDHVRVPKDAIAPTGQIMLEGHMFRCPHEVVCFLEAQYGYIGSDAHFDASSKMYVKNTP